jgi:hypothetical protein
MQEMMLMKRLLLLCVTFVVMSANIAFSEIAPGTIAGLWLLDEGRGDKVSDSSGNGNHGDILGATWTDGKFGKALEFDGVDDYAEIPDAPSLDGMDELTVAAWVFLHSHNPAGYNGFVDKTAGATDRSYNISQRNGQWECGVINDTNARLQLNAGATADNAWIHLAGTYDGSEIKLYENGTLIGSLAQSGAVNESNTSLQLGRWPGNGGSLHAECILDEVVVFNVALDENDISLIMKGMEAALSINNSGKLAAQWGAIRIGY